MKKRIILLAIGIISILFNMNAQVVPGSVVEEEIDSYLSESAANSMEEIPVVVVRYLPTTDEINIDVAQATDYWSLGEISINNLIENIDTYDKRAKFSLEEGSKFRGYKDNSANPYLGYRIVKYLTVYRQIQVSDFQIGDEAGVGIFQPNYKQEFDDLNLTDFIQNNNVKEVWLWYGEPARSGWPSYDEQLHGDITSCAGFVESNMASPTTGDISNSYRFPDDLYIFDHTYVVYGQNFRRSQAEVVHNHGHQLESIYKYVAENQDGNISMFVQKFSGWGDNNYTIPPLGRAGDTHHPPNTEADYDYLNTALVESDIEDWKPFGGTTKLVNVDTWGNLNYNWPGAPEFSQRIEAQWYIYWMQNMPGHNNNIPYDPFYMTNWWEFTADWDSSINNNLGLYAETVNVVDVSYSGISIYPNPTNGVVNFDFTDHKVQKYTISDIIGKQIIEKTDIQQNERIDFSNFQNGIYIINIQTDKGTFTTEIVKK